jgi:RNA polymerase sigma-70 factor (ECF subfamily)
MLSTFLGKIVRNLAFNRYKHNTADKRSGGEIAAVLDELAGCVSGNEDTEQAYEYKELVAAINDFLGTLPTEKRNIFVCRYWYTDSISDIAARYNMTYSAVSMMLNRLRTKLHNYLTERGYEL